MKHVPLRIGPADDPLTLRELSGRDEAAVSGVGTADAVSLIDRLIVHLPRNGSKRRAVATLAAADRDRLMAAVYISTYGPRVESSVVCSACQARFDIDFDLETLLDSIGALATQAQASEPEGAVAQRSGTDDQGYLTLPDGRRFRLPTGEDEIAVAGLPADEAEAELLRRCLDECDAQDLSPEMAEAVQSAMASVAPTVDTTVEGRCPECGESAHLRFDLQRYLLTALLRERGRLIEEIHNLASVYGWSLAEILDLPRSQRRALVDAVRRFSGARRARASA